MGKSVTKTFVDPETGDEDEVTFPTDMNGWKYDPDENVSAAIAWIHPERSDVYVGWEKTGGQTWSAWLSVPGKIPADTIYRSYGKPDRALDEAKSIMQNNSPKDAVEEFCTD